MPEFELESLLSPLAVDAPCGADLEYDPAFLALQEAAVEKPEQQYGDTVIPPQSPDWRAVHEQALQLATRTRDLRVAVWLTRAGARVEGLMGAVRGLRLVQGLLEQHWDHVHPQLDAADHNDPTARMNALLPLVHASAGLADLRAASLTGKRGALTVREIELALGQAEPLPHESVPSPEGVVQAVAAAVGESSALAEDMQSGYEAVQTLSTVLEQHLEPTQSLELAPVKKLLQRVAEAGQRASSAAHASDLPGAAAVLGNANAAIATREDALRALDRVCEWIERNEPSNPAPLLIRRSQRLMSKSFIDIIRDLMPEGLDQVEKLAGLSNS